MIKILYAIQATGNGHLSRAREIIPHLLQQGEVDLLVSGTQAEVQLPYLIKYRKNGLGYAFGKDGGINFIESIRQLKPFRFLHDIFSFPVQSYDLIINDFEPISAWACYVQHKASIALSHQASYLSPLTPRPKHQAGFAEWVLRNYAPATSQYGFHFQSYDSFIHTPVIRREIRHLTPTSRGHITVYLPAHDHNMLIPFFAAHKEIRWEIFSKHALKPNTIGNIVVSPISHDLFTQSLSACDGIITAGGFESVAEAMYLQKKVMIIPMLHQYEQQCNAVAAGILGNTVLDKIDEHFYAHLEKWLNHGKAVAVNYPDQTGLIIEHIVQEHLRKDLQPPLNNGINSSWVKQGSRIPQLRKFSFGNLS